MKNYHEDDNRSAFVIAYMAVAFGGAVMGFLAGVFAGWMIWGL